MKRTYFVLLFLGSLTIGRAQKVSELDISEPDWSYWDSFHQDSTAKFTQLNKITDISFLGVEKSAQIKVIEIDGVAPLDLIYFPYPDSLPNFQIYLNSNFKATMSLESNDMLIDITRELPLDPIQFKTAKFDSTNFDYEVSHHLPAISDGQIEYVVDRVEILKEGVMDVYGNMPPTRFKVEASTKLLIGPGFNKLVKNLTPGDVGYAAASLKTKTGENWWKVFIQEEDYKWRMGWVRRENVVKVFK